MSYTFKNPDAERRPLDFRREHEETTRRLREIAQRQPAEPVTVKPRRCPECRAFGIPAECLTYGFCLLCSWRGELQPVQ
jgi:hypothetical protein